MQSGKPVDHFERLVFRDAVSSNVRLKKCGDDRRHFISIVEKWAIRRATGCMPPELPALPNHSVVSITDKKREAYGIPDPKLFKNGSAMQRVAALVKGKREVCGAPDEKHRS